MGFLCRNRTMLHALGNNEHLARSQRDDAVAQVNVNTAFEHQKEIVRVLVLMPNELALDLDHHQVVTVELTHHARLPVLRECRQLGCEIDGLHGNLPHVNASWGMPWVVVNNSAWARIQSMKTLAPCRSRARVGLTNQ